MLVEGGHKSIHCLTIPVLTTSLASANTTYNGTTFDAIFNNIDIMYLLVFALLLLLVLITKRFHRRKLDEIKSKQDEYRIITEQTMRTIAKAIDAKDPYTRGHSYRVADYSVEIAKRLHMREEEIERIRYIALMHDIGKIGIPNAILQKPHVLTDEEYQIIKQHPTIGGEILKDITHIKDIVVGAEYHHEHYDGTGYPKGLKGNSIPLVARIIGVADSYDTMTSNRPYRKGMPKTEVIEELKRCSGTQFDPELVNIMVDIITESL